MHVVELLDQQRRHRRQARPDLDHRLAAARIDGFDDAVQDQLVGQKILAEALACYVFHSCFRLI
jgi:hypothetical protein